jgi:large subunit ribosomal protein L9
MPKSVVLLSDVPGLGQIGDHKKVKDGYAFNYLLPQKLAVIATPNILKKIDLQKSKLAAQRDAQLANSKSLAEKIGKLGLVFERPLGPGGKLFGSVTPLDIAAELAKHGASVEKKSVLMNGPLKAAGDHTVRVRVHSQVVVDIPVKVIGMEVKKEDSEHAAPVEEIEVYGQEEDL